MSRLRPPRKVRSSCSMFAYVLIGFVQGLYRGYIGIIDKNMEATIEALGLGFGV